MLRAVRATRTQPLMNRVRSAWCAIALLSLVTGCEKKRNQNPFAETVGNKLPEVPPVPSLGKVDTPPKPPLPDNLNGAGRGSGKKKGVGRMLPRGTSETKTSVAVATFTFETTPPGAIVRLIGRDGQVIQGVSPAQLAVPPGSYKWEVELNGYVPDQSGASRVIVGAGESEKVRVPLTALGDRKQILERAQKAFANVSTCDEAITLFEALTKPSEMNGQLGTEWVDSRLRIAQCGMALKDYDRALAAIADVRRERPRAWLASYYEAQIYCDIKNWRKGATSLNGLSGTYVGAMGVEERVTIPLLVSYQRAICDMKEYDELGQPERNKELLNRFLDKFDEFIDGAERLKSGRGFPAEYEQELTNALMSAKRLYEQRSKS